MPVDELALKRALANQISPARKAVSMPPMVPGGNQPEMRTYNPSLGEMLAGAISRGADKIGLGGISNRLGQEGRMLAEMVPGVGDAIDANEMGRAASRGDYLSAALSGAALALPVVGGSMLKKADEPVKKGIRAYHGSPHDFDRFSLDKIGTGEGAQAYGHGLYFADSEDVARSYRDALADKTGDVSFYGKPVTGNSPRDILIRNVQELRRNGLDDAQIVSSLRKKATNGAGNFPYAEIADYVESAPSSIADMSTGRMYEVNINANPDDVLDWDKPFASADDVERFAAKFDAVDPALRKRIEDYGYVRQQMGQPMPDGNDIIREVMGGIGSKDASRASDIMREAGIPGIKYLDGMSRSAGEGSRNYVVFDDALIEIVRKYGLAGAVSAGLISEEMARQMQEQGAI